MKGCGIDMKLITFLVPCYNSEKEMDRCIESLLVAGEQAEIIIVDDGSTDSTGQIADGYARTYPSIVRVIHQENGGHGEGINQGIRHARGTYFKIVDSDDWLDPEALKAVMKKLGRLEASGGVDLMVCNYVYEHADPNILRRYIRYRNVFPQGRVVTWEQTRPFLVYQLLTLHSCIFRTRVCRRSGVILPRHVSYEDNLFVYGQLPYVKSICYMNQNLYRYFIGREGQSVSKEVMSRRWEQQMFISEEIFKLYRFDDIRRKSPKLYRYMFHESLFMFLITTLFTRLNDTPETEQAISDMWVRMRAYDWLAAVRMQHFTYVQLVSMPGETGRDLSEKVYNLAQRVGQFN